MSIKVENIIKEYGTQRALDDVSFEVHSGEVVGFLGPNGAGKSTMMKILTCYLPCTSGKAWVSEFDVEEQSMEVRKNIGYLPEHNPLYLDMYVKEYLGFIADLHKLSNTNIRVKEIIETTGLHLEQNKKIGALSKGYRQRVGLAQALIHDPKVLILDEPTTGLDPNQLEEIRGLIKEVGKEKTILLSTHIMQEVEAVCNRVIIINKGRIVANDSTDVLQQSSVASSFSIIVEFDKQVAEELLLDIAEVLSVEHEQGNKWRIASSVDIRATIFQFAVKQDVNVLTLQADERKLEDVFKSLTA